MVAGWNSMQEPRGRTEAKAMEEDCLLTFLSTAWSYTAQKHLPKAGTTYTGPCPPTPISNRENAPQIIPQANLWEQPLSWDCLFPGVSRLHQIHKNQPTQHFSIRSILVHIKIWEPQLQWPKKLEHVREVQCPQENRPNILLPQIWPHYSKHTLSLF